MSTPLSSVVGYINGATWMDVYVRTGATPKTLATITEADWVEVAGFREGTLNMTGDDITSTVQPYENGQAITTTMKDGTYGFEGNIANISKEVAEFLLKATEYDTSSVTAGTFVEGRDVIIGGKEMGLVTGAMVRLRIEDSPVYDYIVFLNVKLASKFTGAGSSDDLFNISISATCDKSNDADTQGEIYAFIGKKA